jgi:hypothetical protein
MSAEKPNAVEPKKPEKADIAPSQKPVDEELDEVSLGMITGGSISSADSCLTTD